MAVTACSKSTVPAQAWWGEAQNVQLWNIQNTMTALAEQWRSYAFQRPGPPTTEITNSRTIIIINRITLYLAQHRRTPLIRIANYPNRLGPSGKSVENSTKLSYFESTGYRIKYSTLRLIEFQIRRGRKV
jgi:hypothetical protein